MNNIIGMKHFGGEAQKQNHEGLKPKVNNIVPMWKEVSMKFPNSYVLVLKNLCVFLLPHHPQNSNTCNMSKHLA